MRRFVRNSVAASNKNAFILERSRMFEIKAEDNYCRDIIFAIRKLDQVAPSTVEEKIDAIRRIGNVSWTGGPLALRRAGGQIPKLVQLFEIEAIELRTEVIKTLAAICVMNRQYQETLRVNGFLNTMIDFLRLEVSEFVELQKWILYCVLCVLVENVENQRYVLDFPHTQATFSRYQTETWHVFKRNIALELSNMLGYGFCANT